MNALPKEKKHFYDVVDYIDKKRVQMRDSVDFFATLQDSSLPWRQRLMFMPYMLFFSLGSPDIKTLMMIIDKPENRLSVAERKINAFIKEDNFHYNFYLRDLERLNYGMDRFGSTGAVVRHVFAEEGIPTRRLVYAMGSYINQNQDPIIGLVIPEIIEASLYELFTTIYLHIVKTEGDEILGQLEYFGDTHVKLEQHHTVTHWFAPGHPKDEDIDDLDISLETFDYITGMVDDLMGRFAEMYENFDRIIKSNVEIEPAKFDIKGSPHIDKITSGRGQF